MERRGKRHGCMHAISLIRARTYALAISIVLLILFLIGLIPSEIIIGGQWTTTPHITTIQQLPITSDDIVEAPPPLDENEATIHITHIYPAYYARDKESKEELDAVLSSWKIAQSRAKSAGIHVEILAASLPEDAQGVPTDFVKHTTPLTWRAPGPDGELKFPTVGQTMARGAAEGRGKLLLYTNADIGTFPDFYIKVMEIYKEDPWSWQVTSRAFDETIEFWKYCRSYVKSTTTDKDWMKMCKADAAIFFENVGGAPGKFNASLADIIEREVFSSSNDLTSSTALQHVRTLLQNSLLQSEHTQLPLGLTITRLDVLDANAAKGTNTLQTTSKVETHPGNDCFVFPRDKLPRELWDWGHPVGFRPWGWWLPSYVQRTMRFRRIVGTPEQRFTFHVSKGLWGMKNDGFQQRATDNPSWAAFLAGNWFAITRGVFALDFENTPAWCTESFFVRHQSFCRSSRNSAYCQGTAPLSCASIRPHSRDATLYVNICSSSTLYPLREALIKEPICSFCRFLLRRVHSDRSHLKCVRPPWMMPNGNKTMIRMEQTQVASFSPVPYMLQECSKMDCVSYRKDWLGILPEYKA